MCLNNSIIFQISAAEDKCTALITRPANYNYRSPSGCIPHWLHARNISSYQRTLKPSKHSPCSDSSPCLIKFRAIFFLLGWVFLSPTPLQLRCMRFMSFQITTDSIVSSRSYGIKQQRKPWCKSTLLILYEGKPPVSHFFTKCQN